MPLRELPISPSNEDGMSRRSVLWMLAGSGVAVGAGVSLFRKRALDISSLPTEPLEPKAPQESQPEIPSVPLPTFEFKKRDNFSVPPSGLNLSQEEFLEISLQFAFTLRNIFQEYAPAVENPATPTPVIGAHTFEFLNQAMRYLNQIHPALSVYFQQHQGEFQEPRRALALLNHFLTAAGLYLSGEDLERPNQPVTSFFDLYEIDTVKDMKIRLGEKEVEVPVLYLKQGSYSPSFYKYASSVANTIPELGEKGIVIMRASRVPYIYKMTLAELEKDGQKETMFSREGMTDADASSVQESIMEGLVRHEGTHVLFAHMFPKTDAATDHHFNLNVTVPISTDVTFGGGRPLYIRGSEQPVKFEELGSVAVHIATGNHFSIFNFYSILRGMVDSTPLHYELVKRVLLHALATHHSLPEGLRKNLLNFVEGRSEKLAYTDISALCTHVSFNPDIIREIGRTMWKTGYDLLQRGEAYLNK